MAKKPQHACSKCRGSLDDGGTCENPKFENCDRAQLVRTCEGEVMVAAPTPERPHRKRREPCSKVATKKVKDPINGTLFYCAGCVESYREYRAELAGEAACS